MYYLRLQEIGELYTSSFLAIASRLGCIRSQTTFTQFSLFCS